MLSTDLQVYRALENGRCSNNRVNSGVVGNVFTHVKTAERLVGRTQYAKLHWCLRNVDNKPLLDPEIYIDKPTAAAGEYVVKCVLPQRTTVALAGAAIDAANCVGSATLKTAVAAGATTLVVTVKGEAMLPGGVDEIFRAGETIRACTHTSAVVQDGVEEDLVISGTPTYSGLDITITLTAGILSSFPAGARVSSLISAGATLAPSYTTPVVTSTAGTINATSYPPVLDNIGTPEEDLTFTFTSATAFSCTGDSLGAIGSGTVSTAFSPLDAVKSRPLLTLPAGFFAGTWVAGNTVTMTLHPATLPIGEKQVVLPESPALGNNSCAIVLAGEVA